MAVEYAAIWRAWELTERDMRRLMFQMGLRRIGRGVTKMSQTATFAAAGVGAFGFALRAAMAAEDDAIRQARIGLDT